MGVGMYSQIYRTLPQWVGVRIPPWTRDGRDVANYPNDIIMLIYLYALDGCTTEYK